MKVPPALWSWTGGYIGVHGGGGYGRTSFSDPYGPLIDGDIVNTPCVPGRRWQTGKIHIDGRRKIVWCPGRAVAHRDRGCGNTFQRQTAH